MIQIKERLQLLSQSLDEYFHHEDVFDSHGRIQDSFLSNLDLMNKNDLTKDDFVEIRASKIVKIKFD